MRVGRDSLGNETRAEYGGVHVGDRVRAFADKLGLKIKGPTGTVRLILRVKDGRWRALVLWDRRHPYEVQFEQHADVRLLAKVTEI